MEVTRKQRERVGQEILRIRLERGLTQQAVAFKAGVTQATLSKIENGRAVPEIETLGGIARALKMDLGDLLSILFPPGDHAANGYFRHITPEQGVPRVATASTDEKRVQESRSVGLAPVLA